MKTKIVATAFLSSIILMIHSTGGNAQNFEQFQNFNSQRMEIVHKMAKFLDKTIRKNFPAKHDTSSYRCFLNCALKMGGSNGADLILEVDRKKLNRINRDLFKDENYYFFFARLIKRPSPSKLPTEEEVAEMKSHDSVPTLRSFTPVKGISLWWWESPLNYNGYVRALREQHLSNPLIREMEKKFDQTGVYHSMLLMQNAFCCNLPEVSKSEVKELFAVLFWRCLCYYGGVDLVNRRLFCENCEIFMPGLSRIRQ